MGSSSDCQEIGRELRPTPHSNRRVQGEKAGDRGRLDSSLATERTNRFWRFD